MADLLTKILVQYRKQIKKGNVVIISAPSGTGKTTICRGLLRINKNFVFSISYTTRPKRENEIDGRDYFFVSKEKFFQMVKNNEFLEWAKVYENYYGTSKKQVLKEIIAGKYVLLDIDVQGGKKIKKIFPEGIFIFILPPSWNELKNRLKKRGQNSIQEINFRLKNIQKEIKYIKYYDYIVVNDDLEKTVNTINNIIQCHKYKIKDYKIS